MTMHQAIEAGVGAFWILMAILGVVIALGIVVAVLFGIMWLCLVLCFVIGDISKWLRKKC